VLLGRHAPSALALFPFKSTERLQAADTLVLSGRTSFLGNKGYWTGVPNDPNATAIRREFAEHIKRVDKVVVSDTITSEELARWENTRIVVSGSRSLHHTVHPSAFISHPSKPRGRLAFGLAAVGSRL
jgi:hypothetical protein